MFGSYPGGIMLITTITSSEHQIDISGVFGHLLVAASSSLDGSAVSYQEVDIDFLNGTVELSVEVTRQGVPQGDGYEVALLRPDGTALALEHSDGSYRRELNVSSEVLLGEMYALEVRDLDTGDSRRMGRGSSCGNRAHSSPSRSSRPVRRPTTSCRSPSF